MHLFAASQFGGEALPGNCFTVEHTAWIVGSPPHEESFAQSRSIATAMNMAPFGLPREPKRSFGSLGSGALGSVGTGFIGGSCGCGGCAPGSLFAHGSFCGGVIWLDFGLVGSTSMRSGAGGGAPIFFVPCFVFCGSTMITTAVTIARTATPMTPIGQLRQIDPDACFGSARQL